MKMIVITDTHFCSNFKFFKNNTAGGYIGFYMLFDDVCVYNEVL